MLNDERVIQDFLSRKFLRFNISIIKEPNKAEGKSRGSNQANSKGDKDSQSAVASVKESHRKGLVTKNATNYLIDL